MKVAIKGIEHFRVTVTMWSTEQCRVTVTIRGTEHFRVTVTIWSTEQCRVTVTNMLLSRKCYQ